MKIKNKIAFFSLTSIGFSALFFSCSNTEKKQTVETLDLPLLFNNEIKILNESKPAITKNVQEEEEVKTTTLENVNWEEELAAFKTLNMRDNKNGEFIKTLDTNGKVKRIVFKAKDTTQPIQVVSQVFVDGKMELIEVSTVQKSWIVDRQVHYSFQPGKGYSISNFQDYMWSSPSRTDISVTFNNYNFLNRP